MRFRNSLLIGLFCAFLCGPMLMLANANLGVLPVPPWLDNEDAAYLSGGVVTTQIGENLSLEGFASGALQQDIEDEVGNYVPAKATALLTNAWLQRTAIEASNGLFRWNCIPTYYGSSLVEDLDGARLLETAQVNTSEERKREKRMAKLLNAFARRHEEVRTFIFLGPDSLNVPGTPTASLMSNPLTYGQIAERLTAGEPAYQWIDGAVPYDEFEDTWYRTDHHWNVYGAYRAYATIAQALGFGDQVAEPTGTIHYDEPLFYGSLTRRGLDKRYEDTMDDLDFAYPDFKVKIDGADVPFASLVHRPLYDNHEWWGNVYTNRYAEYFHTDYGLIEIENPEVKGGPSLLIVGDSYSNSMERFLAFHYAKTYVLDPRHEDGTIDDFLAEHGDIKDVVFVMRATNLFSDVTAGALK